MWCRSAIPSSGVRIAVWPTPKSRSGCASQYRAIHRLYASMHACLYSRSRWLQSTMPTVG